MISVKTDINYDPDDYPRSYGLTAKARKSYLLLGFVAFSAALIVALNAYLGVFSDLLDQKHSQVVACFIIASGFMLILYPYSTRIILRNDAITHITYFWPTRRKVSEIRAVSYIRLAAIDKKFKCLVYNQARSLIIGDLNEYALDDAFERWYRQFPSIDAFKAEQDGKVATLMGLAGETEHKRMRRYKLLKFTLEYFFIAVFMLIYLFGSMLPAEFLPELTSAWLYGLFVLIASGLLLFLRSPEVFSLHPKLNDGRISLYYLLEVPGSILALLCVGSVYVVQGVMVDLYDVKQWALSVPFICLVVIFFAIPLIDRRAFNEGKDFLLFSAFLPFVLTSSIGWYFSYNVLGDDKEPMVYETALYRVVPRDCEDDALCVWSFELEPWKNEQVDIVKMQIPKVLYDDPPAIGDRLCVFEHAGKLGLLWRRVNYCPSI